MIKSQDLKSWDAGTLYREYTDRVKMRATLVGTLYPVILFDEEMQIVDRCIELFGCHPNRLHHGK